MNIGLVKILGECGEDVTATSRPERKSVLNNVKYVKSDAHETAFLKSFLIEK